MTPDENKPDSDENGFEDEAGEGQKPIKDVGEATSGATDKETQIANELLYLRAEFDNYRKRILREQDTAIRFANERLIREMIPVVALFDRANQNADSIKPKLEGNSLQKEVFSFMVGVEMTHKELLQTLQKNGVEFVGAKGEAFDPQRHEAISEIETGNSTEVGTVMEVAQRGCLFSGRLLMPAQVVVGRAKS